MFKITVAPMFDGYEPTVYHFESADELASFLVINSSFWHCQVERWEPATNWAQGGVIIEREGISIYQDESEDLPEVKWSADSPNAFRWGGPTPLIAAMRCFVVGKLGTEVNLEIK